MINNDIIKWSPWVINENCEIDTNTVEFNKPLKQDIVYNETIGSNCKEYRIKSGATIEVSCDFFINSKRINTLRKRAWKIIEERQDCLFILNTSYIENFYIGLPSTWSKGWQNVMIQLRLNPNKKQEVNKKSLETFIKIPSKYKSILIEPINKHIDLERYLTTGLIDKVVCSGGSEDSRKIHLAEKELNSDLSSKQKSLTNKQWNSLYNPDNELKLITEIGEYSNIQEKTNTIDKKEVQIGFVDIGEDTKFFFPLPLIENLVTEDTNNERSEHYSDLNIVKQLREQCELYDLEFSFRSTGDKIIINEKVYSIKNEQDKQSLADFFELNVEDKAFNWKLDLAQIEYQNTINSASRLYEKLLGTYYIERKTEK